MNMLRWLIPSTIRARLLLLVLAAVLAATDNGVRGKLRFEAVPNKAGEILLDFVPSGESVVIKQGDTVFFSGTAPTQG